MKSTYLYYLFLISFTLFSSCKKFVEIGAPKNQLTTIKVFSDSTNANGAIVGIYVNMMNSVLGFCSGGITLYPGLSSDELYQTSFDLSNNEFYNNVISTNNSLNRSLWSSAYKFIYYANACIEGVEMSNGISSEAKKKLIGEAKFIRAFLYFNLVNIYGPIPIVTSTNYNNNRLVGRPTVDSVYKQIIADLQYAQNHLPNYALSNERPDYYTATAMLAKVYLYKQDFISSEAEATKVINSENYNLMPDLNTVFLATSNETIWKLIPVYPGRETWEGFYFVPSSTSAKPRYVLTNELFNSFEIGDLRKSVWINVNAISGQQYPYPYKYKKASSSLSMPGENYTVLRLSEQYLIRAEAKARLDNISGAIADLNVIRNRAGLPNSAALDKTTVLSAIEKERRAELFCEWGNRWFDLKRSNRVNDVLAPVKSNWQTNAALYPIPLPEINANPNLSQNEGY